MTNLPLFDPAHAQDPAEAGVVPGLLSYGCEVRGEWLAFWAIAGHGLYYLDDRRAVMRLLGYDPSLYEVHPPAPILRKSGDFVTWWQAKRKEN